MNDDKRAEQIAAGLRATGLLASEAFRASREAVEVALYAAWRTNRDRDERDRIWISLGLLDSLVTVLQNTANNGRVAQSDLDRLIKGEQ